MKPARLQFIDFDARPTPKTNRFCCKCQKDLKLGQPHRYAYVDGSMCAVHPEDIEDRGKEAADYGWLLLGMDCAKAVGLKFSVDTIPEESPPAA